MPAVAARAGRSSPTSEISASRILPCVKSSRAKWASRCPNSPPSLVRERRTARSLSTEQLSAIHVESLSRLQVVILPQSLYTITAFLERSDAQRGGLGAAERGHDRRIRIDRRGADFHFVGARRL